MRASAFRPWYTDRAVVWRSREIARVLTGHGLGTLVDQAGLRMFVPFRSRRGRSANGPGFAERLRLALGDLGATFIKLGQTLSTRADLLPVDVALELAKLQDAAPAVPLEDVRRTIAEDFGEPVERRFPWFDPVPLASASIGQVHAARLGDGREVVVKVRRPGVVEVVERDLDILFRLVEWTETHTALGREYDLMPIAEEFAYTIHNELDYRREAENAQRLALGLAGDPAARIPRVHEEHSTSRVLTLERVGGTKINDLETLDRLGIPRRTIAENAVRIFLREVLDLRFFHADPHPGNFFVQPDGSIAIVDFGMVGRLTDASRDRLLRAGWAAIQYDAESLAESLFALGVAGRRANRAEFVRDLDHVLGRYEGRSVAELSAAAVTRELQAIAFRHRLQLPGELALLLRVVAMSEGIGLMLDPDFRYLEFATPLIRRRWEETRSIRQGLARMGRTAAEAGDLMIELPRRVGRLLGRLERGELEMTLHHEGLDRLSPELQRMTNRLALSMILAASVVALGVGLGVHGFGAFEPLLRWLFVLGFVFSLVFGVWLLASIWRSGRN